MQTVWTPDCTVKPSGVNANKQSLYLRPTSELTITKQANKKMVLVLSTLNVMKHSSNNIHIINLLSRFIIVNQEIS